MDIVSILKSTTIKGNILVLCVCRCNFLLPFLSEVVLVYEAVIGELVHTSSDVCMYVTAHPPPKHP